MNERSKEKKTMIRDDSPATAGASRPIRPRLQSAPRRGLVETGYLREGQTLPLVITPTLEDVDLADWAMKNREYLEQQLLQHGAILFRGFKILAPPPFERLAAAVCRELFHENGEHPRESISGNVYTPVFFSPRLKLLWHNENSFNLQWPSKILFCCVRPADEGGETPIVDSRHVFERLRPALRDRFLDKGVMYMRNYSQAVGLSWRTVFQTEDREEAERYCRRNEMTIEWKDGDRACTRAVRPAAIRHPQSGAMSWFNQAQHFHVSCLEPETREALEQLLAPEDLPRNCFYGDGSPIEDSVMSEILEAYQDLEVSFRWQPGDVMLLDNILVAHARSAFSGERKILVAMGDMTSYTEI